MRASIPPPCLMYGLMDRWMNSVLKKEIGGNTLVQLGAPRSIFEGFWGVLGASWGSWRGSWGPGWLQEPSRCNFLKIWPQLGGQLGLPRLISFTPDSVYNPSHIHSVTSSSSSSDSDLEGHRLLNIYVRWGWRFNASTRVLDRRLLQFVRASCASMRHH